MSKHASIFRGLKSLATEKIVQGAKDNMHRLSGSQIRAIIKTVVATKSKDQLESIIGDMIDGVNDDHLKSLVLEFLDSGHLNPSDIVPAKTVTKKAL